MKIAEEKKIHGKVLSWIACQKLALGKERQTSEDKICINSTHTARVSDSLTVNVSLWCFFQPIYFSINLKHNFEHCLYQILRSK